MEANHQNDEPKMDFTGLILGFCSAALSYLGLQNEQKEKNLILAKQNIDILEILAAKTKGNLTSEEEKLIQQVLMDLRLKFIEAARR